MGQEKKQKPQAIKEEEGLPGELRSKSTTVHPHAAADQLMLLGSSLVGIMGLIDEESMFSF